MDELILTHNNNSISFDLYDYRCDKYTHEIIAYVGHNNIKYLYKFFDRDCLLYARFILSSETSINFNLEDCNITNMLTYDEFIQVSISISDISQYTNCKGLRQ